MATLNSMALERSHESLASAVRTLDKGYLNTIEGNLFKETVVAVARYVGRIFLMLKRLVWIINPFSENDFLDRCKLFGMSLVRLIPVQEVIKIVGLALEAIPVAHVVGARVRIAAELINFKLDSIEESIDKDRDGYIQAPLQQQKDVNRGRELIGLSQLGSEDFRFQK